MLPVAKTWLSEDENRAIQDVLNSGWVTQGPYAKEFENCFARQVGAQHACAVSNGTAALHLALLAVGVEPGDVVITVSASFIATANAVRHAQAEPVFVDVDSRTLNLDPRALEHCLKADFVEKRGGLWYRHVERLRAAPSPLRQIRDPVGRLGAILVVHQLGMPADMPSILALTRELAVPVIEDAACALGSEISLDGGTSWQMIGAPVGDVACFSFHPRKVITTGEGGMITTSCPTRDRQFRALRHHGMTLPDAIRHAAPGISFEEYECTAFNYRMSDIHAAVGVTQLQKLGAILSRRRSLAKMYQESLHGMRGVQVPFVPDGCRPNWQSFQVHLSDPDLQKPVMQALFERGITTRRGVMCAHLEAPYKTAWPQGSLPASERTTRSGVILPLFPGMTGADVHQVASALNQALEQIDRNRSNASLARAV